MNWKVFHLYLKWNEQHTESKLHLNITDMYLESTMNQICLLPAKKINQRDISFYIVVNSIHWFDGKWWFHCSNLLLFVESITSTFSVSIFLSLSSPFETYAFIHGNFEPFLLQHGWVTFVGGNIFFIIKFEIANKRRIAWCKCELWLKNIELLMISRLKASERDWNRCAWAHFLNVGMHCNASLNNIKFRSHWQTFFRGILWYTEESHILVTCLSDVSSVSTTVYKPTRQIVGMQCHRITNWWIINPFECCLNPTASQSTCIIMRIWQSHKLICLRFT